MEKQAKKIVHVCYHNFKVVYNEGWN